MGSWRALVVAAHPDDIEFGCGGTVARWADQGADVTFCIATDGTAGTQDRDLMGKRLHDVRVAESEAAADVLGAKEIVWLGPCDGYVEYNLELRREIARVFRRFKPHRFVVMDPAPTIEDRFINHPDHRAVGQASLDVSMTAGTTPGIFPELLDEGLDPWRGLRELWIAGPGMYPVGVDITPTMDRKVEALLCHVSQVGEDREAISEWVRQSARRRGEAHGFDYAENFRVISEGPGFHAGEQDDVDFEAAPAPLDPRSAPSR
ncbi:MAG: PIG-L deacetylase family protein [Actinomycetota bacterium]